MVLTAMPMMTVSAAYENTHVNTGDQAADIVAVAMTQVGYLEGSYAGTTAGSNNVQKYGLWYDQNVDNIGVKQAAWCAAFVSWCANQAGVPSTTAYYHAYCPFGVNWYKNRGLFQYSASRGGSYTPKAGDIIYFQSSTEASHVGIVRYSSGGRVYTVEGNTSGQNGEVNVGGGVFAKSYALSYANILGYGTPNYETTPGSYASQLGTYKITASSLNVRSSASTSGTIVGELANGALVTVSELSNGWGKVTLTDGTTGWCAISDYGQYIGVDALNTELTAPWGGENLTCTTDASGRVTFTNSGSEGIAVDMPLPLKLGTKTTPSMSLSVTVNKGGWYFGLTQAGSGYFMMRDCTSGDELVNASTAPYMTSDEQLRIDVGYWWTPEEAYQIDTVRLYLNADSSVTVNYFYFESTANTVTDTTYNMRKGTDTPPVVDPVADPINLKHPASLDIVDRNKAGYYSYQNGTLTVCSQDANGYEVSFAPNVSFKPAELKYWVFSANAEADFDIALTVTTADGDRQFSLGADFYPEFGGTAGVGYIPARNGSAALDLYSCYTWNNIVPADGISVVKAVTVRVKGEGTVTLNEVQLAANDVLTVFTDAVQKSDSSLPAPPPPVDVNGDVNGDSTVSTVDARLIISHLLGSAPLSEEALRLADYNGDGVVATSDVRDILTSVLA